MFKSKIEVRQFAVEQAVKILGAGTPDKDVVSKAKEIEAYLIGDAELPETYEDNDIVHNVMDNVMAFLQTMGSESETATETEKEKSTQKK